MEHVSVEHPTQEVALVTMSNPALENQGSWKAISELAVALKQAREAGDKVCVLASAVPERWLSHAYLKDLVNTFRGQPMTGDPMCWMQVVAEITHPGLICMAAVSGIASGGGAELCWACDLRVAEEDAAFCQPEVTLGLPPGLGGTSRLSHLAGRTIAAEMALEGGLMGAKRLYEVGAINRLVPKGNAVSVAVAWAERLVRGKKEVLTAIKQQLLNADTLPLGDALAKEQLLLQQAVFKPETLDGLAQVQARYDAGESMAVVNGWTL